MPVQILPKHRVPIVVKRSNSKKTQEQYINDLSIKNPNVEVVDEYVNAITPILHKFLECGHITMAVPSRILNGGGCPLCRGKHIGNSLKKTHESFVQQLYSVNPNIQVLGEYINSQTKIQVMCLICQHIWKTRPQHLLEGHGCALCAGKRNAKQNAKSHDEFIFDMKYINPNIEILEIYQSRQTPILCKCLICNFCWYTKPTNLYKGHGCLICCYSNGERQIRAYLNQHQIEYIYEYKFDDLLGIGGRPLSYDFYLPQQNALFEYQGQQHYEPIQYFGGEKQYQQQLEHDKRKKEYALLHHYNFLEISYKQFNNIENILDNFFNNLKLETVETTGVA